MDGLLAKEDHQLPFAGHVVSVFDDIVFDRRPEMVQFVGAEKVVVCNPERKVVVGAVIVIKPIRGTVGGLVCTVEPLNHLLIGTEFRGNSVIVRQADDLSNLELELLAELMEELLGSKRIGAIAVSDETEVLWQLLQMLEGHAHGHDAGTDTAVVRDLIADHGTGRRIDDQPDIALDVAYFDICLIGSKGGSLLVRVGIDKWFDTDGGSLTVVGDHLVGDSDSVDDLHRLSGLPERQSKVHPIGNAQGHDVSIVLREFQRGGVLRQGGDIHLAEVDREFPVDVMQLILVLAISLVQICLVNLPEVVEVVRALGIYTLMDDEMFTVFLTHQSVGAIRTLKGKCLGKTVLIR